MESDAKVHKISTLANIKLKQQPNVIRRFPTHKWPDDSLSTAFIAATYDYIQPGTRIGSLVCFDPTKWLPDDYDHNKNHPQRVAVDCEVELGGILGSYWIRRHNNYGTLSITSELVLVMNDIYVGKSQSDDENYPLYTIRQSSDLKLPKNEANVALSLSLYEENNPSRVAVTSSEGIVYIVQDCILAHQWNGHNQHVWISSFVPGQPKCIATGSDDCTVKFFDTRLNLEKPTATITSHIAGVTCIKFVPESQHYFYTGGFDQRLFLWDVRAMDQCLKSHKIMGAVWDMEFMQNKPLQALIAGSHDGCFVYSLEPEIECLKEAQLEEPLVYGVSHFEYNNRTIYLACNFYGKEIFLLE